MNDGEYIYLVGENILTSFSNIFIIDIQKDLVNEYTFQNTLVKYKKSESFLAFIDEIKNIIHSDDNEKFINIISGKFEDSISCTLKKTGSFLNESCVLLAKKLLNNGNEIIMVTLIDVHEISKNNNDNNNENDKMIEEISDVILKIYNTIDLTKEDNPAFDYIRTLFEELNRKYPKLNKNLEKNIINDVNKSRSTLLIVDDDIITRNILKKAFEKDFDIVIAGNGKEAINLLEEQYNSNSQTVLNLVGIFLDLEMPILDGFAVLEYLESKNILNKMPVIIISGVEEKEKRQRVYNYNIADMLEKPFNLEIIRLRINNFIRLFKSSNSLTSLIVNNDKDINQVVRKLEKVYLTNYEKNIKLVAKLTDALAKKYLEVNPECGLTIPLITKIIDASKYYDIGKLLIPNYILNKNNLTIEEEELLKEHTMNGGLIVKRIFIGKDPILAEYAYNIAMYHHENLDSNYSKKYGEKGMPLYLSIVSLAILYAKYVLEDKEINDSVIATNIIALENKQFSSELIDTFRLVLNDFSTICRSEID